MIFDKNQSEFSSDFCREIWWWACGLVPTDISLTDEIKNKCDKDVLEGCYQWYDYFVELCEDMYSYTEKYAPASARQYRNILENIAAGGELREDTIVWNINEWGKYCDKLNKSKQYINSAITMEHCINALKHTGIKCSHIGDEVIFSSNEYPKMLCAMNLFETSPNIKKTPARHHFAHCEFRQLFKSYCANYDDLLRPVSDESRHIAHSIHDIAKSLKIQRYIHFDTIKYKYKNIRVMDFSINGDEYPTMRVNIGTCANPASDINNHEYYSGILAAGNGIQETFLKNLEKCVNHEHKHPVLVINGKEEQVCPYSKIKINPFKKDIDSILYFINARQASIDRIIL